MAKQPQAQLAQALGLARQALVAEPEPVDKATLSHAINLLQRVYDKNKLESGAAPTVGQPKQGKLAKSTYSEIAASATPT